MNAQFLSDGSDFRSRGGGGYLAKNRRDNSLFWWTILITLLLGVATFCWFFSIMVFKYPEKPFNYRLLTRLEKLDPVVKFDPLAVGNIRLPNGTFHGARDLLAKFYNYNQEQLRLANDVLKRSYILNYSEDNPVYVKGTYTVVRCRPLSATDFMPGGWVVRARSVELEDVELEVLLPGTASETPPYQDGETFALDNKTTFASVLNVERNANDGLCVTVVPIVYGTYTAGNQQTLSLAPPAKLNMEAPFPAITLEANDAAGAVSKVAAQSGF